MKRPASCLLLVLLTIVVPLPARLARADAPAAEGGKAIAAALQPFVDSHTLAGAVFLVANKDKVLCLDAVGYADVAAKKPIGTDATFWIASMSKPMTATGLMILVDEGKVNVDDPVEKYLPEFKGQMVAVEQDDEHALLKRPAHPILVRNVLSHTSGLPFMSRVQHKIDEFPLAETTITYALSNLKFQPDSKYEYSNAGINTAGRIIEVVSGMPYERFMDERLFKPLGMKDTTFWPNEQQLARLAKAYKPNAAKNDLEEMPIAQLTYPLIGGPARYPCPAGGLFSTAADVGVFSRMILNGGTLDGHRYVSEASVQQMTSTQDGELQNKGKGENGYGFGWATSRKVAGEPRPGSGGRFGHGGAYATDMEIDAEHGLITVYMVQHGGYPNDGKAKIGPAFKNAVKDAFQK